MISGGSFYTPFDGNGHIGNLLTYICNYSLTRLLISWSLDRVKRSKAQLAGAAREHGLQIIPGTCFM